MKILIAEDDAVSRRVLAITLTQLGHDVVTANNGLEAWAALQKDDAPRLAILDWMMPGLEGPEVCRRVRANSKTAPTYLILLTALRQKEQMVEGLEAGADDYLTKPFDRHELRVRLQAGERIVGLQDSLGQRVRELEAAIVERKEAEEALRNLTLTDDLTGLYNRRGFFTIAEHQIKSARRSGQESLLFYADMDGLKKINDTFGHSEGSLAIGCMAEVLRRTFRESDVVARLGGDEFAIFASRSSSGDTADIIRRLRDNLDLHNKQRRAPYQLSISIGVVSTVPENSLKIEQLLELADERMYENKRNKNNQRKFTDIAGSAPQDALLQSALDLANQPYY